MSRRDGFHVSISVHPGHPDFNASVAEISLGQRIFSASHSEHALLWPQLSLQLVGKSYIATSNQDFSLLAKIFCNCLFIKQMLIV